MNGEQKPLEKTLSLMGMDILDDETRKKLNGMMRQAIQADATETAPAKYMAVSGLTSYCVGAWLFSLSGDCNALFAVGGVMAVLSAGFILYDERTAKKRAKAKAQAEAYKELSASITEDLIKMKEAEARLKHGWVTVKGANSTVVDATKK